MLRATPILLVFVCAASSAEASPREVSASRRQNPIVLDGKLAEADWQQAPAAGEFWQREPNEGAPPVHATEFRVLYDNNFLYIGVTALEDEPRKIRGLLTRRDEDSSSDWIFVGVDSYQDKRTSFSFGVNPAGVQRDFLIYDDVEEDESWDAVWEVATHTDGNGWSAEFRIPYSQLRFSSGPEQRWGIQVTRVVQHSDEVSMWAPAPRSKQQNVSLYGEASGIVGIQPPRRFDVTPYVLGGLRVADVAAENPYENSVAPELGIGVDFSVGLTTNLTLSGTINPDFGQVEVDPSQVNLTANETFFEERRPFFVEGADIFRFSLSQGGDDNSEQLFYSRRIGAPPSLSAEGTYVDQDAATNILGAGKLSGKTRGGWSLGAMSAVTNEEQARVEMDDGTRSTLVVEPLTNYSVLRLRKDRNEGRTTFDLAGTGVHRKLSGTGLGILHKRGYGAGLRVRHRDAAGDWSGDARLIASSVHGSAEALTATQTASRHYFQRPDASHLRFDPNRTSLQGMGLVASVAKTGHPHWRGATGVNSRSPGLEVNDLGFQTNSDFLNNWVWGQYRDNVPGALLREWRLNGVVWSNMDWAPTLKAMGADLNGEGRFANQWELGFGSELRNNRLDSQLLRGGPSVRSLLSYGLHSWLSTDERKTVQGRLRSSWWHQPTSRSWNMETNAVARVQVRSNLNLEIGAFVSRRIDDTQYVDEFEDTMGDTRYLLARIRQTTVGATLRANYTFSPHLSLQLYAQPFVSSGRYKAYKEPDQVRSTRYGERFYEFEAGDTMELADGNVNVDLNRDGIVDYQYQPADFSFRELKSTLVVRWEYRPGSTLFAIWSHNRDGFDAHNSGALSNAGRLGDKRGEHVALMKLTYRWGG